MGRISETLPYAWLRNTFSLSMRLALAGVAVHRARRAAQPSVRAPRRRTGLTQESVTAVLQDRHGYMWLGTQAGLNRYDGYRMTAFKNDPANARSLLDNYVHALYEDSNGTIWIGSKGGLDRYDPATLSFVHQLSRSGNLTVFSIVGDGQQGLWLSTSDGLQHLDIASGQVKTLRHAAADADSINDDRVSALARDKSGNLWVGTASGLEMLAAGGRKFRHLNPQAARRRPTIYSRCR